MLLPGIFINRFVELLPALGNTLPWHITARLPALLTEYIDNLSNTAYQIKNGIAIHHTAVVEAGAIIKAPAIIGADCFIASHAYLRSGVLLAAGVKVGTGCEIKSSIIFYNTAIAHFNFIGDSIIGSNVNFEAGAIVANHFNERSEKEITVIHNGNIIKTGVSKFGCLAGDDSCIGANAVLSPGTILNVNTIVKRLELINQCEGLI